VVNLFNGRWKGKDKQPTALAKIRDIGKPPENLKQQVSLVMQRIDLQTQKLDMAVKRFETRDSDLFGRVIKAISERDEARANIFATELSEIRKIEKILTQASLAMQSVSMRLNTISEMGDLVAVLSPAKTVLNSISSEMCGILPEASQELGSIGNLLSDIVGTTCQTTDMPVNTSRVDPEAEKILREAEFAAEKKLKQQLPDASTENSFGKYASLEA
jgi:division protein CdvB (Snf7/Vps24/ESCRT-III family)